MISQYRMRREIYICYALWILLAIAVALFVVGSLTASIEYTNMYTYLGITFLNLTIILCVYECVCRKRIPNTLEEERIIRAWDRRTFMNEESTDGYESDDDLVSSSERDKARTV